MAAGYKTGGRQKGSRNKKTRGREAMLKLASAGIEDADPLVFLLKVMADTQLPLALRFDAAVTAAPFCHPKLRPVTQGKMDQPGEDPITRLLDQISNKTRGRLPSDFRTAIEPRHNEAGALKNG